MMGYKKTHILICPEASTAGLGGGGEGGAICKHNALMMGLPAGIVFAKARDGGGGGGLFVLCAIKHVSF